MSPALFGAYVERTASEKVAILAIQEDCYAINQVRTVPNPGQGDLLYREECRRVSGLGETAFEGSLGNVQGSIHFYRGPYVAAVSFKAPDRAAAVSLGKSIDEELQRWLAGNAGAAYRVAAAGAAPTPTGVAPIRPAGYGVWPNERTSNQLPDLAFDGNTSTYTWTTESFNDRNPSYFATTFAGPTLVSRIRLFKDNDSGGAGPIAKNLVVEYTTGADSVPINSRT